MKIEVKTENLLKCLQSVIGVVERKQTMPILANVLVNVVDEKLSITATDLDLIFVHQIKDIEVIEEGKKILDNSGLKIISAVDLSDAAKKVVESI